MKEHMEECEGCIKEFIENWNNKKKNWRMKMKKENGTVFYYV